MENGSVFPITYMWAKKTSSYIRGMPSVIIDKASKINISEQKTNI